MTWQWTINQIFALIGLVFIIISFQQKDSKKLLIFRNIATLVIFIGLCIFGNASAIILCGAGVIRNIITLYFAYKPNASKVLKYVSSALLMLLVIVLNIIYWKNLFNLYSIVLGIVAVITFMQSKASTIRKMSVFAEILAIVYYALLLSPINTVVEVIGLISVIVGIIRLDIKKNSK